MSTVNIAGLDRAELLARMWNHAYQSSAAVRMLGSKLRMTRLEAQALLDANTDRYKYFDYVSGVCLKSDLMLEDGEMDTALYDRDNGGPGTLAWIVKKLR